MSASNSAKMAQRLLQHDRPPPMHGLTPPTLGDETQGKIIEEGFRPRGVPGDFFFEKSEKEVVKLPVTGKAVAGDGDLFSSEKFAITFGHSERLGFDSKVTRDLTLTGTK